nr:hypothetical protein Iba_scaffold33508CG0030 [Ipomoea batatas]GMC82841.1 hypothetical protein Iba_chr04bCG17180 [Ipomoea batatas]GMC86961.1 hypothetical protein Iba_chr04dCG15740 [Ipomoea batatas]GMC90946.1 hypothetical protein Iba_chr04fCG12910 [Ipomoea batatas]
MDPLTIIDTHRGRGNKEHQRVTGVLAKGTENTKESLGCSRGERRTPNQQGEQRTPKTSLCIYASIKKARFPYTYMVDRLPFKICWVVFVWVIPPPPQPPKDNTKPLTSLAIEANDLFLSKGDIVLLTLLTVFLVANTLTLSAARTMIQYLKFIANHIDENLS